MVLGLDNVFVQVALVSVGVFFLLEWTKPSIMYDEKSGQPKHELITPCTVAVACGLIVLALNYKKLGAPTGGSSAPLTAAGFQSSTVPSQRLADLEGWEAGPGQAATHHDLLAPETFEG